MPTEKADEQELEARFKYSESEAGTRIEAMTAGANISPIEPIPAEAVDLLRNAIPILREHAAWAACKKLPLTSLNSQKFASRIEALLKGGEG